MLRDDRFHLFSGSFGDSVDIKHQNLVLAALEEVLHRVPTVVLVTEEGQDSLEHKPNGIRRIHKRPNLLDVLGTEATDSLLGLLN